MTKEILAFDPERRNSAQAIADLAALGYLNKDQHTLDATYGQGRFWRKWRPWDLITNDRDIGRSVHWHFNYRAFPELWGAPPRFDVVVFDPPFKLNGTGGSHAIAEAYGVDDPYRSLDDIVDDCWAGMDECVRVTRPRGLIIYKTQQQVSGARVRPLAHQMCVHATEDLGLRLEDELYIVGYRKQPEGKPQRHARSNCSAIQVYRKAK